MLPQNSFDQGRNLPQGKKKLRWFVALSTLPLLGVVTAFGLVPQSDFDFTSTTVDIEEIALSKAAIEQPPVASYWRDERVQRGDTVDELLRRLSIEDQSAGEYLRKSADAESFRKLPAGTEIQAETTDTGGLISLSYLSNDSTQIMIQRQGGVFHAKMLPAQLENRLFVRSGEIKTNLYAATDEAGLPDAAANQLNELFSGDIDFHHDLRKGDRFTVIYEMTYSNGVLLHMGRIQAAEFINQGHVYRALYFQKDAQHGDYYTPEGKSVHKAFLRSPIAYSRVSSSFSLSRFHPILNKWRSHKGTDFAAAMGTPVKVTADGVVSVVGKQGGYGNVIMVTHQGRYTTVYGHLSRFVPGLHKGQHVSQGEVIGYVGMTGLATGPHLHYEFRVNGRQQDPLRVALPDAKPIDSSYLAAFQPVASGLVARLNLLRNTNLAQLD
ncbi:MAG TPA: peptidoglycan DD-metalloendopeptidase family protein [Gallionella sp.]|nr:peptidoglycan DD-metalloendopeptidase family protein [Gallionella sp.]